MATQDLSSKLTPAVAFNLATVNTDTTTNGVSVDTQGYESIMLVYGVGALTDGDYTPLVQESSDNSNWSNVADADLIGAEADKALSVDNTVSKIGYKGNERYVRASVVSANTTTGADVFAVAVQGDAHVAEGA